MVVLHAAADAAPPTPAHPIITNSKDLPAAVAGTVKAWLQRSWRKVLCVTALLASALALALAHLVTGYRQPAMPAIMQMQPQVAYAVRQDPSKHMAATQRQQRGAARVAQAALEAQQSKSYQRLFATASLCSLQVSASELLRVLQSQQSSGAASHADSAQAQQHAGVRAQHAVAAQHAEAAAAPSQAASDPAAHAEQGALDAGQPSAAAPQPSTDSDSGTAGKLTPALLAAAACAILVYSGAKVRANFPAAGKTFSSWASRIIPQHSAKNSQGYEELSNLRRDAGEQAGSKADAPQAGQAGKQQFSEWSQDGLKPHISTNYNDTQSAGQPPESGGQQNSTSAAVPDNMKDAASRAEQQSLMPEQSDLPRSGAAPASGSKPTGSEQDAQRFTEWAADSTPPHSPQNFPGDEQTAEQAPAGAGARNLLSQAASSNGAAQPPNRVVAAPEAHAVDVDENDVDVADSEASKKGVFGNMSAGAAALFSKKEDSKQGHDKQGKGGSRQKARGSNAHSWLEVLEPTYIERGPPEYKYDV